MIRTGSAKWQGNLAEGRGVVSTASGALSNVRYSFSSRFQGGTGTNPEELIGAAHAGCYSMALSNILAEVGHVPDSISTTASIHLDKDEGGFSITRVHLEVSGVVPGIDDAGFQDAAAKAKAGCPVSRALGALEITMEAHLVQD